jgi:hypothetical protein
MNNDDIFKIEKVEYHYLPLCECADCERERERRKQNHKAPSKTHQLSPQSAHILGILPSSRLSGCGSVARKLASL